MLKEKEVLRQCFVCGKEIKIVVSESKLFKGCSKIISPVYTGQDKYRHLRCVPGSDKWMHSKVGKKSKLRMYFKMAKRGKIDEI
jgi:hypothetical protein